MTKNLTLFLLAFLVIGLAFAGLSAGLIMRKKPIVGSCGGVMTSEDGTCTICGRTESNNCTKTDS